MLHKRVSTIDMYDNPTKAVVLRVEDYIRKGPSETTKQSVVGSVLRTFRLCFVGVINKIGEGKTNNYNM